MKNSGKPPKGMYVNHDDLVALATGPTTQGEQILKAMDREIVSYKRTVSFFRFAVLPTPSVEITEMYYHTFLTKNS